MGIITKEVEVRVRPNTLEHYKSLGYKIPMKKASDSYGKLHNKEYVYDFNTPIKVRIDDLPKYSKVKVFVLCDMCKENTVPVVYENYISVVEKTGTYVCQDCAYKKVKQTVKKRYNVDSVSQLESVKNKVKETLLKKYNVEHALQSDIFKNRAIETTKKRYGVKHALQSPEIRQKVNETLCKNGVRKTSLQQLYLHSLYNGEINYPIKYYATDICFPEEKLYIEYDGGGHFLRATLGHMTQEEFDQKEIIRNNVIKREGYKQMRIISSKDKLPYDQILLRMLEQTRKYFSDYPNHSWIEFNIDASIVRNAENKDGVFYDYGELRKIKKSDIENSDENVDCA